MDFRISNKGSTQDIEDIRSMLEAYNTAHGAKAEKTPVGIFYEDDNKKKLAGLIGNIFGNWLFVEFLFVDETLRGQGVGKKLVALAEENARAKGCKYSFLCTNSFQAPGFYEKLGYKRVFTLREFPRNGERYYYVKELCEMPIEERFRYEARELQREKDLLFTSEILATKTYSDMHVNKAALDEKQSEFLIMVEQFNVDCLSPASDFFASPDNVLAKLEELRSTLCKIAATIYTIKWE